jgi:hypothetical protein
LRITTALRSAGALGEDRAAALLLHSCNQLGHIAWVVLTIAIHDDHIACLILADLRQTDADGPLMN